MAVFCLVDDHLRGRRPRSRRPAPKLSDAEVLTMEIVGEFLALAPHDPAFALVDSMPLSACLFAHAYKV